MKNYSLEEISAMWAEDGPLDQTDVGGQISNVAQLHNKYFKIYNLEKARHKKYTLDYKQLVRYKNEYYLGILDKETLDKFQWKPFEQKVLRTDLQTYVDADPDIITLLFRIENSKIKIDFLDSIIKMINVRGIQLRTLVDWRRFEAGLNGK